MKQELERKNATCCECRGVNANRRCYPVRSVSELVVSRLVVNSEMLGDHNPDCSLSESRETFGRHW